METALYFPYIHVPTEPWFTKVLLYWDSAASIVPRRLDNRDAELGSYTSELISAGLLQEVDPYMAQMMNYQAFDETFTMMLDAYEPRKEFGPRRWTRMHQEKASPELFNEMAARGLAHKVPGDQQWWKMEERTAGLYMSYLVGSICRVQGDMFPVSGESDALTKLAQPVDDTRSHLNSLLSVTIKDVLPAPSQTIPVHELAKFKVDHAEQLRHLRIYLKSQLADIVTIDDEFLRQTKIDGTRQEIEREVKHLSEQMSKRNWPTELGAIAAVASPAVGMAVTVITGGVALAIGLGIVVAATGIAGAAGGLRRPPQFDDDAPLAYAALAKGLQPASGRSHMRPFRR
jgi:hypothetical protein